MNFFVCCKRNYVVCPFFSSICFNAGIFSTNSQVGKHYSEAALDFHAENGSQQRKMPEWKLNDERCVVKNLNRKTTTHLAFLNSQFSILQRFLTLHVYLGHWNFLISLDFSCLIQRGCESCAVGKYNALQYFIEDSNSNNLHAPNNC